MISIDSAKSTEDFCRMMIHSSQGSATSVMKQISLREEGGGENHKFSDCWLQKSKSFELLSKKNKNLTMCVVNWTPEIANFIDD